MYLESQTAVRVLQAGLLTLPVLLTSLRVFTLTGTEEQRINSWFRYRRANQIMLLFVSIAWCALSEVAKVHPLVFWAALLVSVFVVHAIARLIDRSVLERRWTGSDILRQAWWGTVHPSATLLLLATGFDRAFERKPSAVFWFILAAITAVLGSACLRLALGFKKRKVKSGTLYVRTLHLAKKMGVRIQWIYVVPSGRGNLTNAFASWRSISLTDNYGEFLHGPQLDSVIAHELAHAKNRHVQKILLLLTLLFSLLIVFSITFAPLLSQYRSPAVSVLLLVPVLGYYAVSRRFEYEADRDSVRLLGNPEAEIRSLAALYRKTGTPIERSNFQELFMTHPNFVNRVSAVAKLGSVSSSRMSQILCEAGITDGVPLPTQ
jgi:Zn-dependent protease with chaperone function